MSDRLPSPSLDIAFDGAALVFAEGFASMLSLVQTIEARPFPLGIWQHFPNRRKWYRTTDEFYVLQGDPQAVIEAIGATGAGPDRVIDLIGIDPVREDAAYQAAGYRFESVEILMDRPLTADDAAQADDPRVVGTLTDNQIAMLAGAWNQGRTANGYRPISQAHNTATQLVQRFVELDGQAAAYGRAIVLGDDAFLSDVNAFPQFRRRGLGRAVMNALHSGLVRAGATRVVLTATAMGLPLYEQLGYRVLAEDRIYVAGR